MNSAIDNASTVDELEPIAMEVALSTQRWYKQACWPNVARKHAEFYGDARRPVMVIVDAMNWIRSDFSTCQNQGECVEYFMRRMRHIDRKLFVKWMVVVSDDREGVWRKEICPEYKSSRDDRPSEIHGVERAVSVACDAMQVPFIKKPTHEADDLAASLATRCVCRGGNAVICSTDRDMLQIVCKSIVTWSRDRYHGVGEVRERMGLEPSQVVDYLCLCGKDDVPSASGIGDKTARKLLQEHGDFLGIYDCSRNLTDSQRKSIEEFAPKYWTARRCHSLRRDVDVDIDWRSTHCLG